MSASSELLELSHEELKQREQRRETLEKEGGQETGIDAVSLLVIDARAICLEAERLVVAASGAEEDAQDRVSDASGQVAEAEQRLEFDQGVLGNALELLASAEERLNRARTNVDLAARSVERRAGMNPKQGTADSSEERPEA